MNRRTLWLALAVLAALIGVVVWRCHGSEAPVAHDAGAPTSRARIRLRDLARRPPAALAGHVTADGKPAAGALVCTQVATTLRDGGIRCVTSDASGAYAFAELRPGSYALWASGSYGAARLRERVQLATGESKTGIDLVLVAVGVEVSGRVRDTRGRAIPDAFVHVLDTEEAPAFTARTDEGGRFSARVKAAGKIWLTATAARHVDAMLAAVAPTSGLEIVMVAGATVSGIVVEGDQRTPVADARVEASGETATTDDRGRFTISKLNPGRYKPTATAIGRYGEAVDSVLLRPGATVDNVVIELHPVAVVAGRIAIDDSSGRGCPTGEGQVNLTRRGSPSYYWSKTTDNGDVLLEGVVPGSYEVRVSCKGFVEQPPYADLAVGNSDVEDVVWKVAPGARIAGRVTARSGVPIENANVVYASGGAYRSGSVRTAADGTFTAEGVVPGTVTIEATANDYIQGDAVKVTATLASVARAELVLDRGGEIAVTVTQAGKPLPEAYVEVEGGDARAGRGYTDPRGEITLSSLRPGTYTVSARTRWSERAEVAPRVSTRVTVKVGETVHVKLAAETFSGKITGVVVDTAGVPLPDVTIDLAPAETDGRRPDWQRATWSDALGTFEIANLPDQKLSVRARLIGGFATVVEGVALGDHVRITIKPTGSLAGIVVDPSGALVEDVVLEVQDKVQDITRSERLFRTRGRFTFRDLQAGTYRLTVDDDRQTSIVVTLAEGQQATGLVIQVRPRYAIRGRLVAADRTPLAGWNLDLPHKEATDSPNGRTVTTWSVESTVTNARGEFLFEGIVGAEVTLSAGNRARDPAADMIAIKTVKLGASPTIDLGDVVVTQPVDNGNPK